MPPPRVILVSAKRDEVFATRSAGKFDRTTRGMVVNSFPRSVGRPISPGPTRLRYRRRHDSPLRSRASIYRAITTVFLNRFRFRRRLKTLGLIARLVSPLPFPRLLLPLPRPSLTSLVSKRGINHWKHG